MERDQKAAQRFGDWLRDQLTRRGYDLGIRGGGQSRFAEDSGIGRATISRILNGSGATDTRVLALLAEALHLPLGEVLVRAGILDVSELSAVQAPDPGERRITPEQAADELGIHDPQGRAVFIATTQALQRTTPPGDAQNRAAD